MITPQSFCQWAYKAAEEHEAVLSLTALAFIVAMPPTLPGWFGRIETLQWAWGWMYRGLNALVSLQHPTGKTESVTDSVTRSRTVEPAPVPPVDPPATVK